MNLIISLIIATAVAYYGKTIIRKKSTWCYIGTLVASVGLIAAYTSIAKSQGTFLNDSVFGAPVYAGSIATALFIIVMYLGAVPKKHWLFKNFRGIRGQLSIIATILTLVHNVTMLFYVKPIMMAGGTMAVMFRFVAITTLLMLLLLLPLFITSFICVHKKMKEKTWKKVQRLAYPYYALIYIHVLLGNVPGMLGGDVMDTIDVLVYSVVFITYFVLRIKKAIQDKK